MARRVVARLGLGARSRVLSAGCGIGDTELLIAPQVESVIGVDLSPAAVRQANDDARRAGIGNFRAIEGALEAAAAHGPFDAVIAIFFLHHLPDGPLGAAANTIHALLVPGGGFYGLDPSEKRLAGWIGETFFPRLMARYQSPGERPLSPAATQQVFQRAGFQAETSWYDFVSTPLAGLLPGWKSGYAAARLLDEALVRAPGLNRLSSNFEIVARPAIIAAR